MPRTGSSGGCRRHERAQTTLRGVLCLGFALYSPALAAQTTQPHEIRERVEALDRTFNTGSFSQLADFYDSDVTVFQDTTLYTGYREYWEHYLEPEFRAAGPIRLSHSVQHVHILNDGRAAYAASSFTPKSAGLVTSVAAS